jgi:hypothetical protein
MNEDNKLRKILLIGLSVLIGLLFIFSAYTKTSPIQYFEYTIESQVHLPHSLASFLARFFIGLEAGLGLLLVTNIFGYRRWVLKACTALLIVFSIHLLYLLISHGNDVNCGCMGDIVPMSPVVSLLKNAGLLIGLVILLKWHETKDGPILDFGSMAVGAIVIAVPFMMFPVEQQIKMPLSRLYTSTTSQHPSIELRKGKHILCFMSLTCPHCRHAAQKIVAMEKQNPSLPFYFALASGTDSTREERFKDFVDYTKMKNIPYHFMGTKDFVDMIRYAGSNGVPVVLWMQDTTVVRKVANPDDLNLKEIESWLLQ